MKILEHSRQNKTPVLKQLHILYSLQIYGQLRRLCIKNAVFFQKISLQDQFHAKFNFAGLAFNYSPLV